MGKPDKAAISPHSNIRPVDKPIKRQQQKTVLLVAGPLTAGLADLLRIEGYQVTVSDIAEAVKWIARRHFDSVILDLWATDLTPTTYQALITALSCPLLLVLPPFPATTECYPVPIAQFPGRFTPVVQVLNELSARSPASVSGSRKAYRVQVGDICVDLALWQVTCEGHVVPLSSTEFRFLAYLTLNRSRTVGYDELVRAIWGYNAEEENRKLVANLVSRLRRKLGKDVIINVRGVGYRLATGTEEEQVEREG